jgi:hypothetical protein
MKKYLFVVVALIIGNAECCPPRFNISVIDILSRSSKEFSGRVRVAGYISETGLGLYLYMSREHAQLGLVSYAIRLAPIPKSEKSPVVQTNKWVTITGFLGEDEKTTDLERWQSVTKVLQVDAIEPLIVQKNQNAD